MPNFSSLAGLEVVEKFVWGVVCTVIFISNPTVVLRLGWGFDNNSLVVRTRYPIQKKTRPFFVTFSNVKKI